MKDGQVIFPEVPAYSSGQHQILFVDHNGKQLPPKQLAFLQKLLKQTRDQAKKTQRLEGSPIN